jgi:hypothetical protein
VDNIFLAEDLLVWIVSIAETFGHVVVSLDENSTKSEITEENSMDGKRV